MGNASGDGPTCPADQAPQAGTDPQHQSIAGGAVRFFGVDPLNRISNSPESV